MTPAENRNVYLDQVVAQQERLEQNLKSKRAPAPAAAAGAARGASASGPWRRRAGAGRGQPAPAGGRRADHRLLAVEDRPGPAERVRRAHPARPRRAAARRARRVVPLQPGHRLVPGRARRDADHPDQRLLHLPANCRACRPGLRPVDHPGLRHRLPQAGLRRRRRPDAAGQPAAQGAGRGGHQGQGRHHGRPRGAQRQAAHHRGAHRPAARGRRGRGRQRPGARACASSPCRSRRPWSARRGCGRTCRSPSAPSRSAWPGWPSSTPPTPISERELAAPAPARPSRLANERELAELRARNEAASFDREAAEKVRRADRDQEDARAPRRPGERDGRHALALDGERHAAEHEVARLRMEREQALRAPRADGELALARAAGRGRPRQALLDLDRDRVRGEIDNAPVAGEHPGPARSTRCPEIVAQLPKPTELRAVTIGGRDPTTVTGLLAELAAVVGALRSATAPSGTP